MSPVLRTEVDVKPFPFTIGYNTPMVFCGSCFTENIGQLMVDRKMPIIVNPFGVVYNPTSIKLVLEHIYQAVPLKEKDLNFRNGLWFSFLHHSSFSSPDKEECLNRINANLSQSSTFLQRTKCLLITFGTARVYYLNETNQPVANCHKVPAKEFENRLLSVEEIVLSWSTLIDNLLVQNKDLKMVFTISPVRHWKDGAIGNQHSKSILNVAVHELVKRYPNNAFYFPAYEILMDDLRDYRFYADDMLHPTKVAVDYIWEKFKGSLIDSKSMTTMGEVEKVLDALNHRPFNPTTTEHKAFVGSTLARIEAICSKNSDIQFTEEIKALHERI